MTPHQYEKANSIYTRLSSKPTHELSATERSFLELYHDRRNVQHGLDYARAFQESALPHQECFSKVFPEHFVLYKPHSLVSGDFYWVHETKHYKYIVVGDCTGHGVAAAMLSMIGISLLEQAVKQNKVLHPSDIMVEMDRMLISMFERTVPFSNDWIDLSLVRIDKRTHETIYAGANRKLLVIYDGTPMLLHGNRYPIGGWQIKDERSFPYQTIKLKPGHLIYLGSDGFQDQIGGERNKKFGAQKLHGAIASVAHKPLHMQAQELNEQLEEWRGSKPQNDDICIVGIKV